MQRECDKCGLRECGCDPLSESYKWRTRYGVSIHQPPPLVFNYDGIGETVSHRTTADVRFRWLKAIFTQIAKATSYIRKRYVQ